MNMRCKGPLERRTIRYILFALLAIGGLVLVWANMPNRVWYRNGRPTRLGKVTNRAMGRYAALGIPAFRMVTLEVPGRKSGRPTATVLVVAHHEGGEYLISMLGTQADWVRNVRAAGDRAVIRHGKSRPVRLLDVPAPERAPILQAYLHVAPGARPHFPIGPDAPLDEFELIAAEYPVFRIEEDDADVGAI